MKNYIYFFLWLCLFSSSSYSVEDTHIKETVDKYLSSWNNSDLDEVVSYMDIVALKVWHEDFNDVANKSSEIGTFSLITNFFGGIKSLEELQNMDDAEFYKRCISLSYIFDPSLKNRLKNTTYEYIGSVQETPNKSFTVIRENTLYGGQLPTESVRVIPLIISENKISIGIDEFTKATTMAIRLQLDPDMQVKVLENNYKDLP